jgi:prepilin-type N-terminal cleavage/methylation domain-containing protein
MMTPTSPPKLSEARIQRQKGFTLIELSITLLVIGLLLGAVAIGRDLQRTAANQRLSSVFIQGWKGAYETYLSGVGNPPGDSTTNPTGKVNGDQTALCGDDMANAFLAAGVRLPEGRTNGQPDRYVYLDSNGNPQEVKVCFQNVDWAEAGSTMGTYVSRPRNVMVISGVTYSLVAMMDQQIDGRTDARFGRLRDITLANATGTTNGTPWPIDDRMTYGTTAANTLDEDQVAVTTALFEMTR